MPVKNQPRRQNTLHHLVACSRLMSPLPWPRSVLVAGTPAWSPLLVLCHQTLPNKSKPLIIPKIMVRASPPWSFIIDSLGADDGFSLRFRSAGHPSESASLVSNVEAELKFCREVLEEVNKDDLAPFVWPFYEPVGKWCPSFMFF